jgi:predicted phosphodiesterase
VRTIKTSGRCAAYVEACEYRVALGGKYGLRLGIVADPHLSPAGTRFASVLGFPSVPTEFAMYNAMVRYRRALKWCIREGADGLALLGDLSWSGDVESLGAGLRLAARTGRAVWTVSGNHDCGERVDAMARAVRRVGAENVRLATPSGEVFGASGPRVAGLCVNSENYGYTAFLDERPDILAWGDEPVVLLSHYPMISFRERAEREGLYYGDNDLENLDEVQQPLLEREAPTVVVNGHIHRRDACAEEKVLQVSCSALYEPPYEITLLDLEAEEDRLSVRVEHIPVAQSSDEDARLSILSPARQRWVFEEGAWYSVESAEPRKETKR